MARKERERVNNKKLGNDYEQQLCKELADAGFWVHNFANRTNGQPADIIAVRDGESLLIDAKVCSDGKFRLSRIEENQHLAMKKWRQCGNGSGCFALLVDNNTYILAYEAIMAAGRTVLSREFIKTYGLGVEDF